MPRIIRLIICLMVFLMSNGSFCNALADHDEHKEKRHHHEKEDQDETEDDDSDNLIPVNNATYSENCGSCHFVYQPGLLPAASWNKILNDLETHFGEPAVIDQNSLKTIAEYLISNAADSSPTEKSVKIMKSLGKQTPLRITEIPYIQKKHHEISQDILARKSIGSLSNCSACHKTAEKGFYDDDGVVIPK
jgi:hypothetical protein